MKVKNLTPFPFGAKVTSRRPPQPEMTLVLRARYILEPGKPLSLPEGPPLGAQGPLTAEVFADDDRSGECLYPGDFADYKPRADLLIRAICHVPDGKPLATCPAKISIGKWSKILRVTGVRAWSDKGESAVASQPLAFTEMPVDYAHAFGGPRSPENPVGQGSRDSDVLPNIEHAGTVVRSRADAPPPAGFGPLNPGWRQRAEKLGTKYGPGYKEKRAPYYAEDFDWSYFNAAPADQQLDYFRGDEEIVLQNLHATAPLFSIRLPSLRVRAFVKDDKAQFREVAMVLDTVFIEPEEGRLSLTWRGSTPYARTISKTFAPSCSRRSRSAKSRSPRRRTVSSSTTSKPIRSRRGSTFRPSFWRRSTA